MISYFLAANCYGFLFYGFYLLLLKGRTSHTWNRVYLLAITLLTLLLPLVKFEFSGWYPAGVAHTLQTVTLPEVNLAANNAQPVDLWYAGFSLAALLYINIAGLLLLRMLYRFASLQLFLRKQQFEQREGYRLAMNTGIGPASFGSAILFPGKEADLNILNHEKAHLQYKHHYDKLLMELTQCVFFPVAALYFIRRELALVHEFEADAAAGTDQESYVYTLLSEHLGTSKFYLLQSFFHHPLKRRIRMLQRSRLGQRNRSAKTGVLLCCLLFTCAIIYAQSIPQARLEEQLPVGLSRLRQTLEPAPLREAVATSTTRFVETPVAKPLAAKDNQAAATNRTVTPLQQQEHIAEQPAKEVSVMQENTKLVPDRTFTSVEQMPMPPMDNLMKYLTDQIRYPDEAKKEQIQGRVVIQFVVDKEGNVVNPVLQRDIGGGCGEEAMRVVRNMPKWKPGRQAGQAVNVYYTLPVSFRLENDNTGNQPTAPR